LLTFESDTCTSTEASEVCHDGEGNGDASDAGDIYPAPLLVPRVAHQLNLLILTVVQPAHQLIRMIPIPILILIALDTVFYQPSPFWFQDSQAACWHVPCKSTCVCSQLLPS
jgi:hypothetical protein